MLRRAYNAVDRGNLVKRLIVPALLTAVLIIGCLLLHYDSRLYYKILPILGINRAPIPVAFLDWVYIPANAQCWSKGVDVYTSTPCDPLGRAMDYSPLWLRATFLPLDLPWVNVWGFGVDLLFIFSLALLPVVRSRWGLLSLLFAGLSSFTLFAIERANVDVIMFALLALSGWLALRSAEKRAIGYGLVGVAGLLKFYPFVVLALAVQERRKAFLAIAAVATITLIVFVGLFSGELKATLHNVPVASYFGSGAFSARNLPYGLLRLLSYFRGARIDVENLRTPPSGGAPALLVMMAISLGVSLIIARYFALAAQIDRLTREEATFFLLGGVVTAACFFSGQNIMYRGILLLLTVQGLDALGAAASSVRAKVLFRFTLVVLVVLMWMPLIAFHTPGAGERVHHGLSYVVIWVVRESGWWWLVTLFDAILLCQFLISAAVGDLVPASILRPTAKLAGVKV